MSLGSSISKSKKLKAKVKTKTTIITEKRDKVCTFNELLSRVNSEKIENFKPCKLSLRKLDAKNRSILDGYDFPIPSAEDIFARDNQYRMRALNNEDGNQNGSNIVIEKPSKKFYLSDKERQEAIINQQSYQDMLDNCLNSTYRPDPSMVDVMKLYQKSFDKDLKRYKKY